NGLDGCLGARLCENAGIQFARRKSLLRQSSRIPASCAREETPESRGMPCLFLNTERGFGGKPPQKSGFRRHLAGSKMPKEGSKMLKEAFFHGDLLLEIGLVARAGCRGFLEGVAAGSGPRS